MVGKESQSAFYVCEPHTGILTGKSTTDAKQGQRKRCLTSCIPKYICQLQDFKFPERNHHLSLLSSHAADAPEAADSVLPPRFTT